MANAIKEGRAERKAEKVDAEESATEVKEKRTRQGKRTKITVKASEEAPTEDTKTDDAVAEQE